MSKKFKKSSKNIFSDKEWKELLKKFFDKFKEIKSKQTS